MEIDEVVQNPALKKIEDLKQNSDPKTITDLSLDNTAPFKLQTLQDFSNLQHLSLENVGLPNLKQFPKLPQLKKLNLSSNKLSSALFLLLGSPQLTYLDLSNNNFKDAFAIKPLGKFKQLESLQLTNCEITQIPEYRRKVFHFVKTLKELDGIMKTEDDAVTPTPDPKPMTVDDPLNGGGKKRKSKSERLAKKLKESLPPKTPLMQLNEVKPGLKFEVKSISGPAHNPLFVVTVEVNEVQFTGQGNSKQEAKHSAATAALKSIFPHQSPPDVMMIAADRRPLGDYDFTKDEEFGNRFQLGKNGSQPIPKSGSKRDMAAVLSEADKKNPVMLLNELHPGLSYILEEENALIPSQRFRVSVVVNEKVYDGRGPNKKQAKVSAARAVLSNLYNVGFTSTPTDVTYSKVFNFPRAVADMIANKLMSTYNEVMVGYADYVKWKIIAGIVMTREEGMQDIQVIGIGTGTKCINGEHISMIGASLNDCHAEIISRRCFLDFLYTNLELHLEGEGDQSILLKREGGGFCVKPGTKFHLYISTAPCGDARIFCPHEEDLVEGTDRHPNRNSRGVLRTKIESGEGTIPIRPGQNVQTWDGILPGHERLLTMSCSDKIAAWNVLGLQGGLLSAFVEPIYLDSIVLGGLFHPEHLTRALFGRFENSLGQLPPMFSLHRPNLSPISSPILRHLVKSPNYSVSWTHGLGRPEVVNATTGKTEKGGVSRLTKRAFFQRYLNLYDRLPPIDTFDVPKPALYATHKAVVRHYQQAKAVLIKSFLDAGLGLWVKKPTEQNEFELDFKNM